MKKAILCAVSLALCAALTLSAMLTLSACGTADPNGGSGETEGTQGSGLEIEYTATAELDSYDLDDDWQSQTLTEINLADIASQVYTISGGGVFRITGSASDLSLVIDAGKTAFVWLVLDGVRLSAKNTAPVFVKSAAKVVITLADGTSSELSDSGDYQQDADGEPNAVIFSKSDLTINGGGALSVSAGFANGIQTKDALKLVSGEITVDAANDAIKGKDLVRVAGGTLSLTAGGDGIVSSGADEGQGAVLITGGDINIQAADDGIQGERTVELRGGAITVSTGTETRALSQDADGGSVTALMWGGGPGGRFDENDGQNGSDTDDKGVVAELSVLVSGGEINVTSAGDALHSNGTLVISGGSLTLSAGDDAVHANESLTVSGGSVDAVKCYEGLESKVIAVSGGTITVDASDDAINCANPDTQNKEAADNTCSLTISGGALRLFADGDGLDSNGAMTISGGVTIVEGPSSGVDCAVDCNGYVTLAGGTLLALGGQGNGAGIALGGNTAQNAVAVSGSSVSALFTIADSAGGSVISYMPRGAFTLAIFSSPALALGESYTVYSGGEGEQDALGLVESPDLSTAKTVTTFTQSSAAVNAGSSGQGGRR